MVYLRRGRLNQSRKSKVILRLTPRGEIDEPSILAFRRAGASLAAGSLAPAQAANIRIVAGTDDIAQTAAGNLNTDLTTVGNTVTVVNTGVPASLTGYTQIYDVRYNNLPCG